MNRKLIYNLRDKYKILNEKDVVKLKEEVTEIRNYSIENLDTLITKASNQFKANGIQVHLVKSYKEAGNQLKSLIGDTSPIVKSKSNVIRKIDLHKFFPKTEIIETDLGDFLVSIAGKHSEHPTSPALSLSIADITGAIEKNFKIKLEEDPQKIVDWAREFLRKKIITSSVGLTGANVLTAAGEIVLLENEGNISLVTRMPEKHIAVATVEKLVNTSENAMKITRAQAHWGTGQHRASYVSFISGPSKTADIQKQLITGAQGAKEVHLILIDDRERFNELEMEEALKCINCGACMSLCPAYHHSLASDPGNYYKGIRFMIDDLLAGTLDPKMPFRCTTCHLCQEICPVQIDLSRILLDLRAQVPQTDGNKEMLENVRKFGNPFGEKPEESEELYCC